MNYSKQARSHFKHVFLNSRCLAMKQTKQGASVGTLFSVEKFESEVAPIVSAMNIV